jgi:N-acyl-D-amino-acid deacylase
MLRTSAALLAGLALAALARADGPDPAVKAAIEKGLKRIEAGAGNYPTHRQCFSCHHQAMAVFSLTAARQRGFAVDADLLDAQVEFSLKTFHNREQIAKGRGVGGDSTAVGYVLNTLAAADHPADDTTAALVQYLLARQNRDGSWPVPAQRPPTMQSLFTNTALGLYALRRYGPARAEAGDEAHRKRIDAALGKARDFLVNGKPETTEDRVFRLRGLVWAGAEAKDVAGARDRLLEDQRDDGSWAQLAGLAGDAYATGTALVALRQAGLEAGHDAYRKGVKYLLDSQREDGSWVVQTRSKPLQVYFDNGDAGGKSQFISFAATNWAVLALLETIPPTPAEDNKP